MLESGVMWMIINVGAVIVLGVALVYGIMAWRNRRDSHVPDRVREQATRDLYTREPSREAGS